MIEAAARYRPSARFRTRSRYRLSRAEAGRQIKAASHATQMIKNVNFNSISLANNEIKNKRRKKEGKMEKLVAV